MGFRGFIIRSMDNITSPSDVWQVNDTINGGDLFLWSSISDRYGRVSLFNATRDVYDTGAYKNEYLNIIPFVGDEVNNLVTRTEYEAIDRGVTRIVYDPSYEIVRRKQYIVMVDVWNYD